MSAKVYRSGAVVVYLPKDEPTIASSPLTSLVFAASAAAWTDANNNDRRSNLDTSASYQIIVSALWHDPVNLGYGMVGGSPGSGFITVTSGQGIQVTIQPGAFPANYAYASGIMLWMSKNGSPFYLHSIYPPNVTTAWSAMIITEPQVDAINKTSAFLQSTTATDGDYPSRSGFWGTSFVRAGDSTNGVTLENTTEELQYKPDLSTSYQLAITRGLKISFDVLNDGISDFVKSTAGEYVKFTSGANTYETALRVYQSASAVSTGNRVCQVIFPIDSHKAAEVLYLFAAIKEIQAPSSSNWGKESPPTLHYEIDTINQDTTLQNVHAVSSRIIYAT